jgi:hypothetical protein
LPADTLIRNAYSHTDPEFFSKPFSR